MCRSIFLLCYYQGGKSDSFILRFGWYDAHCSSTTYLPLKSLPSSFLPGFFMKRNKQEVQQLRTRAKPSERDMAVREAQQDIKGDRNDVSLLSEQPNYSIKKWIKKNTG